ASNKPPHAGQTDTADSAVAVAPQSIQISRMRPNAVVRSSRSAVELTRSLQERAKRAQKRSAAEHTTLANLPSYPFSIPETWAHSSGYRFAMRAFFRFS